MSASDCQSLQITPVHIPSGIIINMKMPDMSLAHQVGVLFFIQLFCLPVKSRHLRIENKPDILITFHQLLPARPWILHITHHIL